MSMRTLILAVTGFGLSVAACSSYGTSVVDVATAARVASVIVSLPASSIVAGQSLRATATLKDANGAVLNGRAIRWRTSSDAIATASDSGVISAIAAGSAVVSAESEGVTGQRTITVASRPPVPVANVSVAITPTAVVVGQTARAIAAVLDSAGNPLTDRVVTWQSANSSIAVVSSAGDVSAMSPGNTSITATSEGKTASAAFSVNAPAPAAVASVTVTPATSSVQVGNTVQLAATTRDASNSVLVGRVVAWSTSNAAIASVSSSGVVSAIAAGSATITATSEGITGTAAVTTTAAPPPQPPPPPPAAVAAVAVSPASANLIIGNSTQLSAVTRDANNNVLTGRPVTWSSANSAVASVSSSGSVSAIAAGTTQISATSEGIVGNATITVAAPAPAPVASVSVSPASSTVQIGSTVQLSATTRDANNNVLTGRAVSWSTANAAIASVSASGLVTGVASGSVQVTATSEGRSASASIIVPAPPPPPPPPPPPGSSNEPTGMTVITERPFSAMNENASWDTDNVLSIVQDATAPKSPSGVLRVTFPSGFQGGSSNGHAGLQFSGRRVLYISYWMKYSANWRGHNTGINKHAYAWVSAGYTPFVMEAEGYGTGTLRPRPILQRMIKGDGNYAPNIVPTATIPRGAWFKIEIVLTGNSSGTANGSMDIYLDGVRTTSYGGLQWTTGATSWDIFELHPVWGGIGDTVPSTQTIDWDHVYVSGKN